MDGEKGRDNIPLGYFEKYFEKADLWWGTKGLGMNSFEMPAGR